MIKAGVIGHPISHSKSPIIHGYWLAQYAIDGEYNAHDIHPEKLKDGIQELIDMGLSGFNVTIPHKQKIIPLCDTMTEAAQKIGAVNTVMIDKDGRLHGDNTDAFGFIENLKIACPDFDWENKTALVIGAGGAARAIVYALKTMNVGSIFITNRTQEVASSLAKTYGADTILWQNRHDGIVDADIIINTTSLGMTGQPPLEISLAGIQQNVVVYDIVYNPLTTPFLKQAEQNGAKIVTGIGMLLHQARPAFKLWFGVYPDVTPDLQNIVIT